VITGSVPVGGAALDGVGPGRVGGPGEDEIETCAGTLLAVAGCVACVVGRAWGVGGVGPAAPPLAVLGCAGVFVTGGAVGVIASRWVADAVVVVTTCATGAVARVTTAVAVATAGATWAGTFVATDLTVVIAGLSAWATGAAGEVTAVTALTALVMGAVGVVVVAGAAAVLTVLVTAAVALVAGDTVVVAGAVAVLTVLVTAAVALVAGDTVVVAGAVAAVTVVVAALTALTTGAAGATGVDGTAAAARLGSAARVVSSVIAAASHLIRVLRSPTQFGRLPKNDKTYPNIRKPRLDQVCFRPASGVVGIRALTVALARSLAAFGLQATANRRERRPGGVARTLRDERVA
jgi:hypothetical protein